MARKHLFTGCAALMLAGAVAAQEARPAPEYFLDAVIATSTAQSLAQSCTTVSVNPVAAAQAASVILTRLEADGFDTTRDDMGMQDSAAELADRQDAFLAKHGLANGADETAVCDAARSEIDSGSLIGALLVALPE